VYCGECKEHKDHQKSIETFKPPPILIIQFKRFFRLAGNHYRKLQTMVEFPLNNLDLSKYVYDYQFLT